MSTTWPPPGPWKRRGCVARACCGAGCCIRTSARSRGTASATRSSDREPTMQGRLDETRPFLPVNIALLTVSDTRTASDDRSGDTLAERAQAAGHRIAARTIARDDFAVIAGQLRA